MCWVGQLCSAVFAILEMGWPKMGWVAELSVHAAPFGYSWKDGCRRLASSWHWGPKAEVVCVWCGKFQLSAPRTRLLDGDLGLCRPFCPSEREDRGVPPPHSPMISLRGVSAAPPLERDMLRWVCPGLWPPVPSRVLKVLFLR